MRFGFRFARTTNNTTKGAWDALDNTCGTAGIVATGTSEFVHIRRFYSHPAGAGAGSARRQPPEWTTDRGLARNGCAARFIARTPLGK